MMSDVEIMTYCQEIERWRKEREAALTAPDGWLSLAGLFMLADGVYMIGSSEANHIVLPPSAPAQVGTLAYQDGKATLNVTTETPVWVNDEWLRSVEMTDNRGGRTPTLVKVGSVSLNLHRFGDEIALRVKDSTNAAIGNFPGCKWYEVKPDYRVVGQLVRFEKPQVIQVTTAAKTVAPYQSVGVVEFELLGQPLRLVAAGTSKPTELFIILRDATSGRSTYGAGRYLYAPVDGADRVTLDFNMAYNPPCAFTPYATCSLPPAENVLRQAIEAGEQV